MIISDVAIFLTIPRDGIVGFANIVLDGSFHVGGIAIHEKLDGSGYRLTYPTRRGAKQVFAICHPIHREASKAIEQAVFEKLKIVTTQGRNDVGHDRHQSTPR